MTWVRLDDGAPGHPKTTTSGLDAFGLWAAGLCHCNRYHTDGIILKSALRSVFPSEAVALSVLQDAAAELVRTKRWYDEGDHWRVHGYEDEQEEALREHVDDRREYERLRKRAQRAKAKARRLAELEALVQRDSPGQSPGTPWDKTQGHPGTRAGHVPEICPPLSPTPDPARPVPARPDDDAAPAPPAPPPGDLTVDERELAIRAELQRHRAICQKLDPTELAESLMRVVQIHQTPEQLRAAIRKASPEIGPETQPDRVRRLLSRYVQRAGPADLEAPMGKPGGATEPTVRPIEVPPEQLAAMRERQRGASRG